MRETVGSGPGRRAAEGNGRVREGSWRERELEVRGARGGGKGK